jgi:hypothetical protein
MSQWLAEEVPASWCLSFVSLFELGFLSVRPTMRLSHRLIVPIGGKASGFVDQRLRVAFDDNFAIGLSLSFPVSTFYAPADASSMFLSPGMAAGYLPSACTR